MWASKCWGLRGQKICMEITKPNPFKSLTVLYAIIVFDIINSIVLTDWTTSLASSALHFKGLSQQEIFLLNKEFSAIEKIHYFS